MDRRIIALYDEYTHAPLDRREFLDRLARITGGTAAAMAMLPLLEANYAQAAVIAPDDTRLVTERVTFSGASGEVQGYLAMPADHSGELPGVIVIHENRGLNPHIQDVARRAALAGFVALAPDFLSPAGGTPEDEDAARTLIGELNADTTLANARAAIAYLRGRDDTTDGIGVVGFCWGGGLVGQIAVAEPDLQAGVVFYGRTPDPADVPNIKAPLLLHYAGLDERINAQVPAFREALDAAGVDYTLHMYEGVDHAFHNDTSAARYSAEAADLAWTRTIDFFQRTLKG